MRASFIAAFAIIATLAISVQAAYVSTSAFSVRCAGWTKRHFCADHVSLNFPPPPFPSSVPVFIHLDHKYHALCKCFHRILRSFGCQIADRG
jgi:hypothetical protein